VQRDDQVEARALRHVGAHELARGEVDAEVARLAALEPPLGGPPGGQALRVGRGLCLAQRRDGRHQKGGRERGGARGV
jgi:hypothetical protein